MNLKHACVATAAIIKNRQFGGRSNFEICDEQCPE